jgi:uncharacterized protein (TIGR03435 family)
MTRTTRALSLTLFFSIAAAMAQQSPAPAPGKRLEFEVVDLRPRDPNNPVPAGKGRMLPGGRIEVSGITLTNMIMMAWGVQEDMISGLPKWAGSAQYDLVAKGTPDTAQPELRLMVQSMLENQFKLSMHREDRVRNAYVLTVGKAGAKLQAASGGPGGAQSCSWQVLDSSLRRRECHNMSMAELARELPVWGGIGIDFPAIDETGLKGSYDLNLDVGNAPSRKEPGTPDTDPADSGPTIFQALEKLGLKLETRKMPVSVIVVDHAEQPN